MSYTKSSFLLIKEEVDAIGIQWYYKTVDNTFHGNTETKIEKPREGVFEIRQKIDFHKQIRYYIFISTYSQDNSKAVINLIFPINILIFIKVNILTN